jgi:hypothetical protein
VIAAAVSTVASIARVQEGGAFIHALAVGLATLGGCAAIGDAVLLWQAPAVGCQYFGRENIGATSSSECFVPIVFHGVLVTTKWLAPVIAAVIASRRSSIRLGCVLLLISQLVRFVIWTAAVKDFTAASPMGDPSLFDAMPTPLVEWSHSAAVTNLAWIHRASLTLSAVVSLCAVLSKAGL